MESILPYLQEWFQTKEDYFVAFAKADTRIEGWFKAELLIIFERLRSAGIINSFKREAGFLSFIDGKRKQIDFLVTIHSQNHLCELKAVCISQAAGTPRDLNFYFRDDHVGLIKDFRKLDEIEAQNKWVLSFIYPSPSRSDWNEALSKIPSELSHWVATKYPTSAQESFFMCLWKSMMTG